MFIRQKLHYTPHLLFSSITIKSIYLTQILLIHFIILKIQNFIK